MFSKTGRKAHEVLKQIFSDSGPTFSNAAASRLWLRHGVVNWPSLPPPSITTRASMAAGCTVDDFVKKVKDT